MRNFRGFSLIEVVIVLFLGSLILLVASRLAHETLVSLRFLEEKADTVQSATLGLERLSSELREAVKLHSSHPILSFDKVDPAAPYALDYDKDHDLNPGEPAGDFALINLSSGYDKDAFDKNQLGTVTYSTDSQQRLLRKAERGSRTTTSPVATSVNTFLAQPRPTIGSISTGNDVFEITLSLREARRIVTYKTTVTVPGLQP